MQRLAGGFVLAACVAAWSPAQAEKPALPGLKCAPLAGTDALLARPERFLLFGEIHGAAEAPDAFGESVCAAAEQGRVIVGVEWPEALADAMNAYVRSGGDAAAQDAFDSVMKTHASFDGRGSVAMIRMFARLRELNAAGADIAVAPFVRRDAYGGIPDQQRVQDDAPYAASLMEQAQGAGRVLVLVGNVHSRREEVQFGETRILPMGMYLPAGSTVSLNFGHAGGAAWNCQPLAGSEKISCKGRRAPGSRGEPGVRFFGALQGGHDGAWRVGALTASPPAFEVVLPPDSPFRIGE